jgi:hypothetical protein
MKNKHLNEQRKMVVNMLVGGQAPHPRGFPA